MRVHAQLMTRDGCGLCDEMKLALTAASQQLAGRVELLLVEVDVDSSPDLSERYGEDVPVLFLEGEKAFVHRATSADIRTHLEALSRGSRYRSAPHQ